MRQDARSWSAEHEDAPIAPTADGQPVPPRPRSRRTGWLAVGIPALTVLMLLAWHSRAQDDAIDVRTPRLPPAAGATAPGQPVQGEAATSTAPPLVKSGIPKSAGAAPPDTYELPERDIACVTGYGGAPHAIGTLVNRRREPQFFSVVIDFSDATGKPLGPFANFTEELAPGATSRWDVTGYAPATSVGPFTCKLAGVLLAFSTYLAPTTTTTPPPNPPARRPDGTPQVARGGVAAPEDYELVPDASTCRFDDARAQVIASGKIVNRRSVTQAYAVDVEFTDEHGAPIDTSGGSTLDTAPGARNTWTATGQVRMPVSGEPTCRVRQVLYSIHAGTQTAPTRPARPKQGSADVADYDLPAADLVCEVDGHGAMEASGTLRNKKATMQRFLLQITFYDSTDHMVGSAMVPTGRIQPGQQVRWSGRSELRDMTGEEVSCDTVVDATMFDG